MNTSRVLSRSVSVADPAIGIRALPQPGVAAFCVNFIRRKA